MPSYEQPCRHAKSARKTDPLGGTDIPLESPIHADIHITTIIITGRPGVNQNTQIPHLAHAVYAISGAKGSQVTGSPRSAWP
jgi:hypothetical protein